MTSSDWITIAAIVIGPIVAVGITLWIEGRRKRQDAKLITLRLLLSSRDFPSDPSYQVAIKLVPVEFNDCPSVLSAHREFLEAANVDTENMSDEQVRKVGENTSVKLTRLLFEMSKAAGLSLRETDIQTGGFGSRGFYYRDNLLQDSQKAMRDVANILWMQTRLLGGETWEQITQQESTEPVEQPEKVAPPAK
ncbi:DUF6680 family protein [Altererythrobacter epoxidivorans]|uniref:DUF6680 family protein n=1 Tax=Altererythrobacter epoxidivorans TaxID=361183 RepID=UPI0007858D70|nr:DUF6680 family protein [Altererythrobacter epoxidivorans]